MDSSKFRHPFTSFRHHIGFDLRTGDCLGLIRNLDIVRNAEDSQIWVYVYYLDEGLERLTMFRDDEVGLLDYHTSIEIGLKELLTFLNVFRSEMIDILQQHGSGDCDYLTKKGGYEDLLDDVKAIMCTNHIYTLHDYQFVMTQHILMGIA